MPACLPVSTHEHNTPPSSLVFSFFFLYMTTEHPTASWQTMQDGSVFYRRQQLYNVQDKFPNFDDYIVAGCKYGGPIGEFSGDVCSSWDVM